MYPRDKSGGLVYISYSGVVDMTPELGLVLSKSPDAKTTEFGGSCKCLLSSPPKMSNPPSFVPLVLCLFLACQSGHNNLIVNLVIEMKFETGDEKLKDLETGIFVGAGRFVVEKDKPSVVEYKISKAVKGN